MVGVDSRPALPIDAHNIRTVHVLLVPAFKAASRNTHYSNSIRLYNLGYQCTVAPRCYLTPLKVVNRSTSDERFLNLITT